MNPTGSAASNSDDPEDIARDVQAIGRIDAVPTLLRVVCQTTGMGFAAVARVTDGTWVACAVQDDIAFGMKPGDALDLDTTLCKEARLAGKPVFFDQASTNDTYRDHHTPRLYNIESYISVPIVMPDGAYFGNLCAIDPRPAVVSEPRILALFELFAQLIGLQLENERKRALEQSALLDERAAGELREQFIAILGHDLRNPLAGIAAGAELIKRKVQDPQLVLVAERIRNSTRRMAGLIDDVLDFARGRLGGGFGAQLVPVAALAPALADVVAELQSAQPERELRSHIDIERRVHCDPSRVQQLVSNLLANALTHGAPDAPVSFDASIDGDQLVLSVHNSGDPIPAEHLSEVFGPFWRRSTSRSREGLGLGLFICAQIVKAHGGRLEVQSSAERGTTFTARLPLGA